MGSKLKPLVPGPWALACWGGTSDLYGAQGAHVEPAGAKSAPKGAKGAHGACWGSSLAPKCPIGPYGVLTETFTVAKRPTFILLVLCANRANIALGPLGLQCGAAVRRRGGAVQHGAAAQFTLVGWSLFARQSSCCLL